jgi:Leucine-rich repeat (LRR) protein
MKPSGKEPSRSDQSKRKLAVAFHSSKGAVEEGTKIKKLSLAKIEAELGKKAEEIRELALVNRGIEKILPLETLANLFKVNLSNNRLSRLDGLGAARQITFLKITDNLLTGEGMEALIHLKNINVLNASNNKITGIPVLREAKFPKLKALILSNNSISSLESFWRLNTLNTLVLSHNNIGVLQTKDIQNLGNLTKLSLGHNKLKIIPNLSPLPLLKELRLSNNLIEELPVTLSANAELAVVDLGANKFEDLNGVQLLQVRY